METFTEEYSYLIQLSFAAVLILVIALVLRLFGVGKKKGKKNGKGKGKKGGKGAFYKQDAYVDHGGDGNTQWQDNDMHATKEGKSRQVTNMDGLIVEEKEDKEDSWENY